MTNKFNVIECCLCKTAFGFSFIDDIGETEHKEHYCYECGHSILLIKSKFTDVEWDKIKDETIEQHKQSRLNQSATLHFLYLHDKATR